MDRNTIKEFALGISVVVVGTIVATGIVSGISGIHIRWGVRGDAVTALVILIIVSAMFSAVRLVLSRRRPPHKSGKSLSLTDPITGFSIRHSKLIDECVRPSNQILGKIHSQYALGLDDQTAGAFAAHNDRRRAKGNREHYAATRFRLISPLRIKDDQVELHLAPMDFALFALLKDQKAPASVKDYIEGRIRGVATQICRDLRPMDPVLNAYNPIPLGVEMVLVTRDGMTLLRKRGKDVATASGEWDVSFSGYCGDKDIDRRTGELDLGLTAKHELEEEIGTMPAEPTDIRFTGLHRNTVTKAIDVLGYWQVEADTDELVRLITRKHPGKRKVFSTSKRAPEAFVWDTGNVVVNFEASDIASLLSQLQFSDDRSTGGFRFMPEAFASLVLALKACGKPMSEPFC